MCPERNSHARTLAFRVTAFAKKKRLLARLSNDESAVFEVEFDRKPVARHLARTLISPQIVHVERNLLFFAFLYRCPHRAR